MRQFSQEAIRLTRAVVLTVTVVLCACDAPERATSPSRAARVDAVGSEAILPFHMEDTGRVLGIYTMANPAHRPIILAHCEAGAVLYVPGEGSGVATHLGRTEATSARCHYGTAWTVRATITAADGDQIFITVNGTGGTPDADGNYSVAVPVHATEGTGRFRQVVLDGTWMVRGNIVDGSMASTLDGTIQYDASDRAER